jgi:hypothetical protein
MEEEKNIESLAKCNPTIQNLVDDIKEKQAQLKVIYELVK